MFEERSFHKFKCKQLSESSSEFYYPETKDVIPPIEQVPIQADDENGNEEENPEPVWKNNVHLQENNNNRVGATFENNFMREVGNLNQPRQRRPPERYKEMYIMADDLSADINEPGIFQSSEAWSREYNAEWNKATDSEYNALMKNGTWELVPHLIIKTSLEVDGSSKLSKGQTDQLKSLKHVLLPKDSRRLKVSTTTTCSPLSFETHQFDFYWL